MTRFLVAALLGLLLLPAAAPARSKVPTLTVESSLGPLRSDGTRALRARGGVPKGARVTVTFSRGKRRLERYRFRARHARYRRSTPIDRTGNYKIRVVARLRSGVVLRVTARLDYGPVADAPSAPEPTPTPTASGGS